MCLSVCTVTKRLNDLDAVRSGQWDRSRNKCKSYIHTMGPMADGRAWHCVTVETNVREYVFYVFSDLKKYDFLRFLK